MPDHPELTPLARVEMASEHLGLGRPLHTVAIGQSMWPRIRSGQVVTVEPCDGGALRVGDVALATVNDELVLHRVLEIRGTRALLKGDARREPDGWWPTEHVLGRLARRPSDRLFAWFAPWLGRPLARGVVMWAMFFDRLRRPS